MNSILKGAKVSKDEKSNMITPSGSKYFLDEEAWVGLISCHSDACKRGQNNTYLI